VEDVNLKPMPLKKKWNKRNQESNDDNEYIETTERNLITENSKDREKKYKEDMQVENN